MRIIITKHARERFVERWNQGSSIETIAKNVMRDGRFLKRNLLKTLMLMGFNRDGYWTATYRVYKDFIFVFQNDGPTYFLQTLFPVTYLKQQRANMLRRFQTGRKN